MAISEKVTVRQIADKANVSTATASRVLNNPNSVKEETRNRVLQAMRELDCQLKRGSDKLLLASFTDFSNPFYGGCIKGMQEVAHQRGYQLFLQQSYNYGSPPSYDFLLNSRFYHGIIFCHSVPEGETLTSLRMKYPIVMCSQHNMDSDLPFVTIDDDAAAQSAINYLISTGRSKIALINSATRYSYAALRERGYREALAAAGLPVREDWIIHLQEIDFELAFTAATTLLSSGEGPDAIFCISDVYGCAALKAALTLGKLVPKDVAIMGFDNINLSTMMSPALSTVSQPMFQLGYQSCNLLIDLIEGVPVLNSKIVLGTEIIVRGST